MSSLWKHRRQVLVSHDTRFLAIAFRGIRERNSVPVMAQNSGSPPIRIEVVGAGADHVNSATAGLCAPPRRALCRARVRYRHWRIAGQSAVPPVPCFSASIGSCTKRMSGHRNKIFIGHISQRNEIYDLPIIQFFLMALAGSDSTMPFPSFTL